MPSAEKQCKDTTIFAKMMICPKKVVSLHRNYMNHSHSGLTGFDGEMKWYVSTRRLVGSLHNLSQQKINWQQ